MTSLQPLAGSRVAEHEMIVIKTENEHNQTDQPKQSQSSISSSAPREPKETSQAQRHSPAVVKQEPPEEALQQKSKKPVPSRSSLLVSGLPTAAGYPNLNGVYRCLGQQDGRYFYTLNLRMNSMQRACFLFYSPGHRRWILAPVLWSDEIHGYCSRSRRADSPLELSSDFERDPSDPVPEWKIVDGNGNFMSPAVVIEEVPPSVRFPPEAGMPTGSASSSGDLSPSNQRVTSGDEHTSSPCMPIRTLFATPRQKHANTGSPARSHTVSPSTLKAFLALSSPPTATPSQSATPTVRANDTVSASSRSFSSSHNGSASQAARTNGTKQPNSGPQRTPSRRKGILSTPGTSPSSSSSRKRKRVSFSLPLATDYHSQARSPPVPHARISSSESQSSLTHSSTSTPNRVLAPFSVDTAINSNGAIADMNGTDTGSHISSPPASQNHREAQQPPVYSLPEDVRPIDAATEIACASTQRPKKKGKRKLSFGQCLPLQSHTAEYSAKKCKRRKLKLRTPPKATQSDSLSYVSVESGETGKSFVASLFDSPSRGSPPSRSPSPLSDTPAPSSPYHRSRLSHVRSPLSQSPHTSISPNKDSPVVSGDAGDASLPVRRKMLLEIAESEREENSLRESQRGATARRQKSKNESEKARKGRNNKKRRRDSGNDKAATDVLERRKMGTTHQKVATGDGESYEGRAYRRSSRARRAPTDYWRCATKDIEIVAASANPSTIRPPKSSKPSKPAAATKSESTNRKKSGGNNRAKTSVNKAKKSEPKQKSTRKSDPKRVKKSAEEEKPDKKPVEKASKKKGTRTSKRQAALREKRKEKEGEIDVSESGSSNGKQKKQDNGVHSKPSKRSKPMEKPVPKGSRRQFSGDAPLDKAKEAKTKMNGTRDKTTSNKTRRKSDTSVAATKSTKPSERSPSVSSKFQSSTKDQPEEPSKTKSSDSKTSLSQRPSNTQTGSDLSNSSHKAQPSGAQITHSSSPLKQAQKQQPASTTVDNSASGDNQPRVWSSAELVTLQKAHSAVDPLRKQFWRLVAEKVCAANAEAGLPPRTSTECQHRFEALFPTPSHRAKRQKKRDLVVEPSSSGSPQDFNIPEKGKAPLKRQRMIRELAERAAQNPRGQGQDFFSPEISSRNRSSSRSRGAPTDAAQSQQSDTSSTKRALVLPVPVNSFSPQSTPSKPKNGETTSSLGRSNTASTKQTSSTATKSTKQTKAKGKSAAKAPKQDKSQDSQPSKKRRRSLTSDPTGLTSMTQSQKARQILSMLPPSTGKRRKAALARNSGRGETAANLASSLMDVESSPGLLVPKDKTKIDAYVMRFNNRTRIPARGRGTKAKKSAASTTGTGATPAKGTEKTARKLAALLNEKERQSTEDGEREESDQDDFENDAMSDCESADDAFAD